MGLGTTSGISDSPVVVEVPDPTDIDEAKKVYFRFSKADSSIYINETKYPLNVWINSPWGTLRFLANPNYYPGTKKTHAAVKYYFDLISLDHATNGVLGNLTVSAASKLSSIINLTFKDPISVRGEEIISEIIVAYNEASAERKSSIAYKTLKFIEDRLKNASRESGFCGKQHSEIQRRDRCCEYE